MLTTFSDSLANALHTWQFGAKLTILVLALVIAVLECLRMSRPVGASIVRQYGWIIIAPLVFSIAVELAIVPSSEWAQPPLRGGQRSPRNGGGGSRDNSNRLC